MDVRVATVVGKIGGELLGELVDDEYLDRRFLESDEEQWLTSLLNIVLNGLRPMVMKTIKLINELEHEVEQVQMRKSLK